MARKRFVAADKVLRARLRREPRHFTLLELYAFSAHNSGRYELALKRWQDVRRVRPDHAMSWCGVAANARELDQLGEAVAAIETAIGRFPGDLVVISEAARVFEKRGDHVKAAELWLRTLDHSSKVQEWAYGAARCLIHAARLDEAENVLARYAKGTVRDKARWWFDVSFAAVVPGKPDFDFRLEDGFRRFGQEAYAIPKAADWVKDLATAREALADILARTPKDVEARDR